mgnify:CR=1 FL=1|tara:strand:- start:16657 stop:17118 length:462 start_codon:yes stop_codon:yes gene_type:complete
MTTKNRVFSRLFDDKKHAAQLRAEKRKEDKLQKVALGLVDEFNYEYQYLQDEIGRLSYSVEEWFDEKFEEFYQLRSDLRSVYLQNSESFVTTADVAGDLEILNQIKDKAEELGLSPEDVYPDWQVHFDDLEYLDQLESKFDDQVAELRSVGLE